MNAFSLWLAPDVLRNLGLALSHFIWQGAAIAAIAAAAIAATRSASSRYLVGVVALLGMVAAPVATFMVLQNTPSAAFQATNYNAPITLSLGNGAAKIAVPPTAALSQARSLSANALNWLVAAWFAGVLLFSLRTAGGLFLVARLRRRDSEPVTAELLSLCRELQQRLGIARAVRFCESLHLDGPAVLGWFRPVVFLPLSALTGLTETQLRAVIAHELAHIRRFDAFVNVFQVAAETLLFYHPAVWWLSKHIRAERENCCDDVALSVCENPAEYARALALMEEWRVAPSFAMAVNRGRLAPRVARLLGLAETGSSLRNAGVIFAILCVATALIAGNALFGIVYPASAQPKQELRIVSVETTAINSATAATRATTGRIVRNVVAKVITNIRALPLALPQSPAKPASAQQSSSGDASSAKRSYIDGMKAEGFDNLSADELIGMKVQGITPEYIHQMRAEGLKPTVDELIGMKVQGITPEYIHQMRALKLNTDVDSLIGMKVQGITPEYVDQIRNLGFQADSDQLIGLKVQGVTPQYVKELNDLGLHPDVDDVIGMKVQGINAEYIRGIRAAGLNPDKEDLIGMKVQGVTPEFIKALQAAGFKPDVDDVISAKVMGLTPEFIQKAQGHGFKNLDLQKIIQLKQAGVLE
jgi:beta-lactamase regulating signal transducer with metallopeptidase domain